MYAENRNAIAVLSASQREIEIEWKRTERGSERDGAKKLSFGTDLNPLMKSFFCWRYRNFSSNMRFACFSLCLRSLELAPCAHVVGYIHSIHPHIRPHYVRIAYFQWDTRPECTARAAMRMCSNFVEGENVIIIPCNKAMGAKIMILFRPRNGYSRRLHAQLGIVSFDNRD